jgi:hypothetical protein
MPSRPFIHDDFLLGTKQARDLYHRYAKDEPIYDYHCHLPPDLIAKNHQFADLAELWLGGDHYKWRAMRTNGVKEHFVHRRRLAAREVPGLGRDRPAHPAQPAAPLVGPRAQALLRHRRAPRRQVRRAHLEEGQRETREGPRARSDQRVARRRHLHDRRPRRFARAPRRDPRQPGS